jgi:putative N6-adenine-specific DNA methylase
VLLGELGRLGAREAEAVDGGVRFAGELTLAYAVNLESRIASRVLWQVSHQPYRSERDIFEAARKLPWSDWFPVTHAIRVDVSAIRAPVRSLDFVTLRVKDAVCDAFREKCGSRPDVDTRSPDARMHVFLSATHCTIYLDTSGEPLFKRGYRKEAGDAPLRENLAAGILALSGWEASSPLLDPMCGSGTFLAEAAMIAIDRAPGLERAFGFEKLSNFDAKAWQKLLDAARTRVRRPGTLAIYGSDRYGDALKLARANLAALGVESLVTLKQADVLEMPPPAPAGVIVTNPPYGVRLGEQQELAEFYPKLGNVLKKQFSGWRVYLLSADMRLPKLIRLAASRRTPLFNGALECRLFEYKMVEGGMRKKLEQPAPDL